MDLREAGSVLRPGHVPSSGIAEGLGPPQRPPSILRCEKGEDVYVLYEEEEEEEEEGGAGESKPPSSHTLYPAKIRSESNHLEVAVALCVYMYVVYSSLECS